ncbi:hypothetical protein RYX36_001237 [Vicia faba]
MTFVVRMSHHSFGFNFLTSLTDCRRLKYLSVSGTRLSKLPKSVGNLTVQEFWADSSRIDGNIPLEIGNMSNLILLSLSMNDLNGPIPRTIRGLHNLQSLNLDNNGLQGSIGDELCELWSLSTLYLSNNKLSGVLPTCLGNMTSLRYIDIASNSLISKIPSSFWSLADLIVVSLSSNAFGGNLPLEIGEIPDDGAFKNFTAQSFMHNEALCGAQRRFSYYELVQATNGFSESNLLGKGSFGSVYQGMLSSGEIVAVKVIDLNFEATSKSFDVECNAMHNLRHRNLVEIISSCSNANFKSMVMKFMSNGSVEKWLYSYNYCLDFLQRLNIIIDVASALEYLHHGSSIPVVHCDLKPSNVLLDRHMVAHVTDFSIAKLLDDGQSKIHRDFSYSWLCCTSFGIMLMEIFTRKRPTDEMEVVDSNLVQQHEKTIHDIVSHVSSIFALSLSCCADKPEERNNITDITASLIKIKTLFLQEKGNEDVKIGL